MFEWKEIPSYPDYEITVSGDIRHKDGSWVDQYMGRANFNEEKHPRVRLRKDGLPIANSVQELLYETYPHLVPKAEEPAPVIKKRSTAPKRTSKRKSKRKPAGRATPFVDDLGPEWHSIPGFSRYKINREGQVINRRTKFLVALRYSSKGSPNYSMLDNAGVAKARHPERLLSMVFKDYEPQNLRKSAIYQPQGEWVVLPNRTKYEIHRTGEVRRVSRHRVRIFEDEQGCKYVKLKTDGVSGFKHFYVSDLMKEIFPNLEVAA